MPTSVVVVLLLLAALSGHDSLQALLLTGLLQHKSRPSMQHKTSNKLAQRKRDRETAREIDSAKEVKLIFCFSLYLVSCWAPLLFCPLKCRLCPGAKATQMFMFMRWMNQELNGQKLKAMHVATVERERCFDAEIAWTLRQLLSVDDVSHVPCLYFPYLKAYSMTLLFEACYIYPFYYQLALWNISQSFEPVTAQLDSSLSCENENMRGRRFNHKSCFISSQSHTDTPTNPHTQTHTLHYTCEL